MSEKKSYRYIEDNRMRDYGDIDFDKKIIRVNKVKSKKWIKDNKKNKAGVLDSIIHEEIHRLHPRMSEKKVQKETIRQKNQISDKQKKKYYSKFVVKKVQKKLDKIFKKKKK